MIETKIRQVHFILRALTFNEGDSRYSNGLIVNLRYQLSFNYKVIYLL